MQTVKFLTRDGKGGFAGWCTTNIEKIFFDFIQYVLDNCSCPEQYIIYDADNNAAYPFNAVVKRFGMRKRTFEERLKNEQIYKI